MHVNQDAVFIAGQKCFKFVDDIERMRNAQVATAANIGPTQWLVNIISYDDNYNVVESVQIQGWLKSCCFVPITDADAVGVYGQTFCREAMMTRTR